MNQKPHALFAEPSLARGGRRCRTIAVALLLLASGIAYGQTWQFGFDSSGNLLTQWAENLARPQILAQPQQQIVGPGELASFFVVAADTRDLAYQWRFNGTNLDGATADTLLLTNVSAVNEGLYSVRLVNSSGSVTSAPAMLWYDGNANGLPDSWELVRFGNLSQTAAGDYDGDGVSNLDEFLDGTDPTNSLSVHFRLKVLNDGGAVDVVPNRPSYTNGEIVTLTATAFAPGFFRGWDGDVVATNNPITLTMNGNKTVVALLGNTYNLTWTNVAGGDWNVATNWDPNTVPMRNDRVFINSFVNVTVSGTNECAEITLGNGNTQPVISGQGMLTVCGKALWISGPMIGDGRTVIAPGASLIVNNASAVTLSRTLENAGTTLCVGAGGFYGGAASGVITNRAGALFEVQNDASFTHGLGSSRFDNAGTFRKAASSGTNTFDSGYIFNNYGIVDLQSGALLCYAGFLNNGTVSFAAGTTSRLAGGGSGSGTFMTPATAAVEFEGSYVLNPGAQLNGAGLYRVGSGGLAANTDVSVQNLDLAAGLEGTGTVTVGSVLNWSGGFMIGSGRTVISRGATLNLTSPSAVSLTRTLENAGTTLCTGAGGFYGSSGTGIITNRPGAWFEVRNDASFTHGLGSCRFDNAGTFRKSLSTGTNTFDGAFAFNNYGTVDLRSGILAVNGGYNSGTGALLNCAIGGAVPGASYARLQVGGSVALNGALGVDLIDGYLPTTNDTFAVVTASTRSGTFAAFQYPSNQVTMALSNAATSVIIHVAAVATPPPPPPLLFAPVVSGSNLVLTWTTVSNATYRLEFNTDLTPSNWSAVPGDVVGVSSIATKADALTQSNRFYRVRLVP